MFGNTDDLGFMQVYRHPFFWGPRLRLNFIRSLSDFLERYDVLLAIQAILRRTVFQLFIHSITRFPHFPTAFLRLIPLWLLLKPLVAASSTTREYCLSFPCHYLLIPFAVGMLKLMLC